MNLEQFRNEIRAEFGVKLEHATPEHMRQFLSRMYAKLGGKGHAEGLPITIPTESASNYEQVIAEFLSRVLDYPADFAVITLWLFAVEMFYTHLEDEYTEQFHELFSFEITE